MTEGFYQLFWERILQPVTVGLYTLYECKIGNIHVQGKKDIFQAFHNIFKEKLQMRTASTRCVFLFTRGPFYLQFSE